MLNVSRSHMWRALKGLSILLPVARKRFVHIKRQQEIIRGNPADKILLEYELQEYIDGGVIL